MFYDFIINKLFVLSQINLSPIKLSDIIKIIRKKFHPSTGDCGMFALGLWKVLQEYNIDCDIYIISDFNGDTDTYDDDEYYDYVGDAYHIFLVINGKPVDGIKIYPSGSDAIDFLRKYIYITQESFHHQPITITNKNYDKVKSFIKTNTHWHYDEFHFYNFIKKLIGNRKLINDV